MANDSDRKKARKAPRIQRGIQSAETACHILKTVAALSGEVTLGELSQRLGMLPGNVHRYLTSLQRHGFITQERASGEYDLGPAALTLGAHAMRRMDHHDIVFQEARKLSDRIDASVYAALWAEDRPVVVVVHNRGAIGPLTVRLGVQVPSIYSGTGRVFLAYRDPAFTDQQWQEFCRRDDPPRAEGHALDLPQFHKLLQSIRDRKGLARVRGDLTKGINAISAPVFDQHGNVVFVITAVGLAHALDVSWNSATASELAKSAAAVSERFGYDRDRAVQRPSPA